MATAKSLSESINEVKNSKGSKAMKIKALKALNITDFEISVILGSNTHRTVREAINKVKFTFGVEIETYNVVRSTLLARANDNNLPVEYQGYNHRDSNTIYKFVSDSSIYDENGNRSDKCIECVTPVLTDNKKGYKGLETCCKTLNEADARVNKSCGLHVHVGAKDLNGKQYSNVFVNYKMLESVIDSFMARSRRGNNSQWCRTLTDHNFSVCESVEDVRCVLNCDRYHKVNCESYGRHRTIEFRQHQGTTDYEKISHWVRFCVSLVAWSMNNVLTSSVESIDDIPFLTKSDKEYYKNRKEQLA